MVFGIQAFRESPGQGHGERFDGHETHHSHRQDSFRRNGGWAEMREARIEALLDRRAERTEAGKLDPAKFQQRLERRFGDKVNDAFGENGSVDFDMLKDILLGRVPDETETELEPVEAEAESAPAVEEGGEPGTLATLSFIQITIAFMQTTVRLDGLNPESSPALTAPVGTPGSELYSRDGGAGEEANLVSERV